MPSYVCNLSEESTRICSAIANRGASEHPEPIVEGLLQSLLERTLRDLAQIILTAPLPAQFDSLPSGHRGYVEDWLTANEQQPTQVRWSLYPLGMVGRWIERAQSAEQERAELLEACREVESACAGGDWAKAIEMCKAAIRKAEKGE